MSYPLCEDGDMNSERSVMAMERAEGSACGVHPDTAPVEVGRVTPACPAVALAKAGARRGWKIRACRLQAAAGRGLPSLPWGQCPIAPGDEPALALLLKMNQTVMKSAFIFSAVSSAVS